MKIQELLLRKGLDGKLPVVVRGLHIVQERLQREFVRHGYGPRVVDMDISRDPERPEVRIDFRVTVQNSGKYRECRLRFEMAQARRHSVQQMRGRRDLSRVVVFLRKTDRLGQVLHRIYSRICLIAADIARQITSWKRHYPERDMPEDFTRTWKRRRRHWCHRQRFAPQLIAA